MSYVARLMTRNDNGEDESWDASSNVFRVIFNGTALLRCFVNFADAKAWLEKLRRVKAEIALPPSYENDCPFIFVVLDNAGKCTDDFVLIAPNGEAGEFLTLSDAILKLGKLCITTSATPTAKTLSVDETNEPLHHRF